MLTLAELSDVKRLDSRILRACAVQDSPLGVMMPYHDEGWQVAAIRYRPEWRKFLWRTGDTPILYGLHHGVPAAGKDAYLVEGESDSLTLWQHGIRALGLPGATTWRDEWRSALGRARPVLVMEPDAGGMVLVKRLAESLGVIWYATMEPHKDSSAAYLATGDDFPRFFRERVAQARVLSPEKARKREPTPLDTRGVLEIAEKLTTMEKRGREWFGLCPFHQEKTASFHVTPEKGFQCFGCGVKGGAGMLRKLAEEKLGMKV